MEGGRLFAEVSHDLRQPLAALSLLLGTFDPQVRDARSRRVLDAMNEAVHSMRQVVDRHFDLARLEAGLLEPEVGTHPVNGVLTRLALDHAPRFEARGLRFTVLPCSAAVRTDPGLLERILASFLSNALRYTERGRVVLGCRRRGDHLAIMVLDTGRGLPPDEFAVLRSELERPSGQGDAGVLGLGLRLADRLARLLGHRIAVDAREGRGAGFTVLVPLAGSGVAADLEDTAGTHPAAPAPASAPDVSRTRVLVIEDDHMVLAALALLLGQWGCAVTAAESFGAAMARLEAGAPAPDLVIADLRLDGAANGIVAIRQIAKALDAPVPGLVLTGDVDPLRLREARLAGYPILQKPVAPLALRCAVARLLGCERFGP